MLNFRSVSFCCFHVEVLDFLGLKLKYEMFHTEKSDEWVSCQRVEELLDRWESLGKAV